MRGIFYVGLIFGFAFLLAIGLPGVLRELIKRQPYPYCASSEEEDAEDSCAQADLPPAALTGSPSESAV
jgi:hypothetical protein